MKTQLQPPVCHAGQPAPAAETADRATGLAMAVGTSAPPVEVRVDGDAGPALGPAGRGRRGGPSTGCRTPCGAPECAPGCRLRWGPPRA